MGLSRNRDSREQVEAIIQGHQLTYSLMQLRLVGLLLLLFLLARSLLLLLPGLDGPAMAKLASLTTLSSGLPLLPLGISLYLLGGGRQRLSKEFAPTTLLHRSLVPLALACLLLLPSLTLWCVIPLKAERAKAMAQQEELQTQQRQWQAEAEQASSSAQVRGIADRNRIALPSMPGEPVELSRWRLSKALEMELASLHKREPILTLSPYELELLSLPRLVSTLLLQLITGIGLLLLHRQGSREIHRHGLTTAMFFRVDPARRRQSRHPQKSVID
jgi:hypothetical protein